MKLEYEKLLVLKLTEGDFDAFESLYQCYYRQLFAFAFQLSKNRDDSEELVQAVFVAVWENRTGIDAEKSFSGYLFQIARYRFYDLLRKQVVKSYYADYLRQQASDSDDLLLRIENEEINEIIQKLLKKVPDRRRSIFLLSRENHISYKKIAQLLNISENTVDTQIRHVLSFLRKELPKFLGFFW